MNDAVPGSGFRRGEVGFVEYHDFRSNEPFEFEPGGSIPSFQIRYETYGRLNADRSNVILVCHALSGDHHCAGVHKMTDTRLGWWNNMIGPGKPIDTTRFFVICSNCIGGCQGSTGPSSIDPETGVAYGARFPQMTIRDMVRAQKRLLDYLGLDRLYAVIGGSMGGMQVLEWAVEYPEMVERILPMATTARQGTQAIAFNVVGRAAIKRDPKWQNGDYDSNGGPTSGLAVARMMAHITYLSNEGMDQRFGRRRQNRSVDQRGVEELYAVESYLLHQGKSFINRFDANTYLYFTQAIDDFDIGERFGSLEEAFEKIEAETLVVGFSSDWLYPPEQNREIVRALLRAGKNASYMEVAMDSGHDSFLVESEDLYRIVETFLRERD